MTEGEVCYHAYKDMTEGEVCYHAYKDMTEGDQELQPGHHTRTLFTCDRLQVTCEVVYMGINFTVPDLYNYLCVHCNSLNTSSLSLQL